MKSVVLLSLCVLQAVSLVKAQQVSNSRSPPGQQESIQFIAGSQGLGAEFSYGLSSGVALRAGASFIPLTVDNAFPVSGINSSNNLTAHFSNIHLLADFTPIPNTSFFRIVGGAAFFMQAKGDFEVQPTGNYTYGAIALTPAETGKVDFNTDWSGLAPYLGIGLGRLFPEHRFNINLDLGSYYLTKPRTSVVGTGLLDGNSSQNAQFNKNMSSYRFLPVAQVNLSLKL